MLERVWWMLVVTGYRPAFSAMPTAMNLGRRKVAVMASSMAPSNATMAIASPNTAPTTAMVAMCAIRRAVMFRAHFPIAAMVVSATASSATMETRRLTITVRLIGFKRPAHGDGIVQAGAEECDPGSLGVIRRLHCYLCASFCGDGVVNRDEVCDDGDNRLGVGPCNQTCAALRDCGGFSQLGNCSTGWGIHESWDRFLNAGPNHACGVIYDGGVYCWGDNSGGQTNIPDGPQSFDRCCCRNEPFMQCRY